MIASFPPVQQYNSFQNIVQSSAKNFLFRLVCTRMYIAETSTKSTHAYFQKKNQYVIVISVMYEASDVKNANARKWHDTRY